MIQMQMIGRLGHDAEVKTLESGKQLIEFSLCHTEVWYDASAGKQERAVWVRCTKWLNQGQNANVAQYMRKGGQIYVSGTPGCRAWDSNGTPQGSLTLTVFTIELLGGGQQQQGNDAPAQNAPAQQQYTPPHQTAYKPPLNNDDLPF